MKRRRLLITALAFVGIVVFGFFVWPGRAILDPTVHTQADPEAVSAGQVDLLNATDFHFTIGDGSGWHGYDVLKVDADGSCEYTYQQHAYTKSPDGKTMLDPGWRRANFKIDSATLLALRQALVQIDYWRLKKSYRADVADGTQRYLKIIASAHRKAIWCDNYFPSEFESIRKFTESRIIAIHRPEIDAAPAIRLDSKDWEPETFGP